jgi:AraC-like DNA-binding protein
MAMKPQHLKIQTSADQSFSVRKDMTQDVNNRWHYHTEVEMICFQKGTGTQFVGDDIKRFMPGDVVLVGSDLPHYWRYDAVSNEKPIAEPYATVIHFYENFLGERFMNLPESKVIKNILEKAKRGLLIRGKEAERIALQIEKIYTAEGLSKIIALLDCLLMVANIPQLTLLSSIGFKPDFREAENERMNNIYNFALNNFKKKISLDEIAAIADLVPNSFCRYFKMRTGKTFSKFMVDIRIGYACKLILENRLDVKQICFESGFNNFSCFHKNFKSITGKTPKLYQETHLLA